MRSRTTIASPPGATIKEQLDDRGMSQKEFALRMDMSEKHISRLINGLVQLTPDVAIRLESVLGIPATFWINLEAIYREKCAKAKTENDMNADIELLKLLPYKEMVKHGWMEDAREPSRRVLQMRGFFEVARLGVIEDLLIPGVACRRITTNDKSDYILAAWVQKAKMDARGIRTEPINLKRLKESLPEIREMTTADPQDFCHRLVQLMSECGIAMVFLPHIGGSFLHGASFYDGKKIVIGLTVRGRDADKFWFSLFHEIAHVLHGHIGQTEGTTDEDEDSADQFAKNTLIPLLAYKAFVEMGSFQKDDIYVFAERVGIDKGIVVGRLQKDNCIPFNWHNDLKTKYRIADQ